MSTFTACCWGLVAVLLAVAIGLLLRLISALRKFDEAVKRYPPGRDARANSQSGGAR